MHEGSEMAEPVLGSARDAEIAAATYEEEEALVRASSEVNAAARTTIKANDAAVDAAQKAADAALRAAEEALAKAVTDAKNSDPSAW